MLATVKLSKRCLQFSGQEMLILQIPPCQQPFSKKLTIGTTISGISYLLRDINSLCRCCRNLATFKQEVHSGKIEVNPFIGEFHSVPVLTINQWMQFKVYRSSSCICGVVYFKFNGVDKINIITNLGDYLFNGYHPHSITLMDRLASFHFS